MGKNGFQQTFGFGEKMKQARVEASNVERWLGGKYKVLTAFTGGIG